MRQRPLLLWIGAMAAALAVGAGISHATSDSTRRLLVERQALLRCLPYSLSWGDFTPPDMSEVRYGSAVIVNGDDVGVTKSPHLLKLVAGLPGDAMRRANGVLYRNGEALAAVVDDSVMKNALTEGETRVLGDHELWLTGTSILSGDSRTTGPVPITALAGTAIPLW